MIVDELDLLRGALARLLAQEEDLAVVACLDCESDVLASARACRPDVAVLGVHRSDAWALATAARLADTTPGCRVLLITTSASLEAFQRALDAKVVGFLSTDVMPAQVAGAVRDVAAGRRVIDPAVTARLLRRQENPLNEREIAVLRLAAEGARSPEIGTRLRLAPGTVRNYLSAITRKLGASNRAEAIRRARDAGWC
jgi:two-component system, NarL family, response regulator DesR